MLEGADMVFITAGMGGGTGTGAAPVVADIARSLGALTVAVRHPPVYVQFEGRRTKTRSEGVGMLQERVDTIIVVPNDKLLDMDESPHAPERCVQDGGDVLRQGVQGISDIITIPGMINVDFADVRAIMANAGPALMGIGTATGDSIGQWRRADGYRVAAAGNLIQGATGCWSMSRPART
jgi:cell division protein FtsZ